VSNSNCHSATLPYVYYNKAENIEILNDEESPLCEQGCWWILRQPYPLTHAFTQSVTGPNQDWIPTIPSQCVLKDQWESQTGIYAWKILC